MPIEPRLQVGNMRGFKKRIIEVEAEFYKTQNASVNSVEVPFRTFDSAVLDTAVAEFTGLKRVGPLLGCAIHSLKQGHIGIASKQHI